MSRIASNACLIRIEERSCCGDCVLGSSRNNEELTCSRQVRAPKNRCCDETLASFRMRLRERLRQRDTDRARGDVDPTLGRTINNTTLPSTKPSTALSFASMVMTALSGRRRLYWRLRPAQSAVRPSLASGYKRSLRDRPSTGSQPCRCSVPQSDKSDFHDECSCTVAYCFPR